MSDLLKKVQDTLESSCLEAYEQGKIEKQAEIDKLKKQLNDSEYLKEEHRKRRCELAKEVEKLKAEKAGLEHYNKINTECINNLVVQKSDYIHKISMATAKLNSFIHSEAGMNELVRSIESALKALRGGHE